MCARAPANKRTPLTMPYCRWAGAILKDFFFCLLHIFFVYCALQVGNAILKDAVKLSKDWGVEVLGRVDAYQRAAEFGYVDASRDRNRGVPALARGVLSLDYEPPKQVSLGV